MSTTPHVPACKLPKPRMRHAGRLFACTCGAVYVVRIAGTYAESWATWQRTNLEVTA